LTTEFLKITLSNVSTDPRNWWLFKHVDTGKDAEVDQDLDNGRRGNQIYDNNLEKGRLYRVFGKNSLTK
jgi:hypothetical protein